MKTIELGLILGYDANQWAAAAKYVTHLTDILLVSFL
jgi:hypothetical protein